MDYCDGQHSVPIMWFKVEAKKVKVGINPEEQKQKEANVQWWANWPRAWRAGPLLHTSTNVSFPGLTHCPGSGIDQMTLLLGLSDDSGHCPPLSWAPNMLVCPDLILHQKCRLTKYLEAKSQHFICQLQHFHSCSHLCQVQNLEQSGWFRADQKTEQPGFDILRQMSREESPVEQPFQLRHWLSLYQVAKLPDKQTYQHALRNLGLVAHLYLCVTLAFSARIPVMKMSSILKTFEFDFNVFWSDHPTHRVQRLLCI